MSDPQRHDNEEPDDIEDDEESDRCAPYYSSTPGQIICDEHSDARIHFMMGIVLYGVGIYIISNMPPAAPPDDIFVYAMWGIFPLLGSCFGVLGIRALVRMNKFGTTLLTIRNMNGTIGGSLNGTIQSTVELKPKGDYSLTLECIEKIATSENKSKLKTRWKGNTTYRSQAVSSKAGIPVSFTIPAQLPESNLSHGHGQIQWILSIEAPTSGLNYKAKFVVPVFAPDGKR